MQIKKQLKNKAETIAEENPYPVEWVKKEVSSLKPINAGCGFRYKEALQYLVRVIDQDAPHFDLLLGLASFATANGLSPRQKEQADKILEYYQNRGVL